MNTELIKLAQKLALRTLHLELLNLLPVSGGTEVIMTPGLIRELVAIAEVKLGINLGDK